MRAAAILVLALGLVACGADEQDSMREKAAAARAAEGPHTQTAGIWSVDEAALDSLRGGGVYFKPADGAMDFHDIVADSPILGTLTIDDDNMFKVEMTLGKDTIDLYGAIGLDKQYIEMFTVKRDGEQLPPGAKLVIVGEVEGDRMMLHLAPWRVWVPMKRN